jgi:hypothetical protein
MKKTLLACLLVLAASSAFAADDELPPPAKNPPDAKTESMIKDSLAVCSDMKLYYSDMQHKLPENLKGIVVLPQSKRTSCQGQYLAVSSRQGGFYFGIPWFLDDEKEGTLEERLQHFTWNHMKENFTAVIDRNPTRDGLFKVTLVQTTERGKMPLEGEIDPAGTIFFFGHFRSATDDVKSGRMKAFEPFLAHSPVTGAANPAVTVIEFSDFECPSCQHAAGYMPAILSKYGDKVRYIRYDLPLVSMHPWAFAATMAGRAIYRQKPELFWAYKKEIYENQDKISAFTIDDFARGFAQSHDLDLKKYDADMNDESLRNEILKGVGIAFTNDIRATPTYVVNGKIIDAGEEGKALTDYVASLVPKG